MNKTTKIIIGIIILLILSASLIYVFKFKKQQVATKETEPQVVQQETEKEDLAKNIQPTQTIIVDGAITNVLADKIIVKSGEVENSFILTNKVDVLSVSKNGIEKKDFQYLSKDQKVSIILNQANSRAVSIQVLGDGITQASF